jgi:hypothetical protein
MMPQMYHEVETGSTKSELHNEQPKKRPGRKRGRAPSTNSGFARLIGILHRMSLSLRSYLRNIALLLFRQARLAQAFVISPIP